MSSKQLKVFFVSNYPSPYMCKFSDEMCRYVTFLSVYYERLGSERPSYWKIPLSKNNIVLKDTIFKAKKAYVSFQLLFKLVKESPDIVIIGGLGIPGNALAYLYAKILRKKVVLFSEFKRDAAGNDVTGGIKIKILKAFYSFDFDAVFAVGEHAQNYFSSVFNFRNIIETTYPIDLELCLSVNAHSPLHGNTINLIYPHRLEEIYSPDNIFKIIDELTKNYGYLVKVKVPSYGSLFDEFKTKVEGSSYENSIIFMDSVKAWSDVSKLYDNNHFSISPCVFSNGNMAIIEAMASGVVPIITPNVIYNSKMIDEHGGGVVCALEDFASEINMLFRTPEKYNNLSKNAKMNAKKYSVESRAAEWRTLLDKVCEK